MIDTDDKMKTSENENIEADVADSDITDVASRNEEKTSSDTADASERAPKEPDHAGSEDGSSAFVGELVNISVKAVAVALSLVMLILSILTVAMPLSAMRVFNKLGMSERALVSGNRYIVHRLDAVDANATDGYGNYTEVRAVDALSDGDMTEALDVCINLSNKLMKEMSGDAKDAEYFGEHLDRYIRIYCALGEAGNIMREKDSANLAAISPALRPFVYDYAHTLMTMDYAARVYTGELDRILENINHTYMFRVTDTSERAQTYGGLVVPESRPQLISTMDGFCDYVDQLGTYLSIMQARLGVTGLLGEDTWQDYAGILTGDEFSLFITRDNGFTPIFGFLSQRVFTKWAQAAVDFVPSGLNIIDEQLHQLYWIRVLTSFAERMLNMGRLLYYSASSYGIYTQEIRDLYGSRTFDYYSTVTYNGATRQLSGVYDDLMTQYLSNFA